jgi:hypothetical protein
MPLKKRNAQRNLISIPSTDRYGLFSDNRLKYQVQNLCYAYILHTARLM